MKKCAKCGETKPIEDFSKDRATTDGHCVKCKQCDKLRFHNWYQQNRKYDNQRCRDYSQNYTEKRATLDANRGKYAAPTKSLNRPKPLICEIPSCNNSKIVFDHDHITGEPRGWICNKCNSALGFAEDNSVKLRDLADYLDRHTANDALTPEPPLATPVASPGGRDAIRCSTEHANQRRANQVAALARTAQQSKTLA